MLGAPSYSYLPSDYIVGPPHTMGRDIGALWCQQVESLDSSTAVLTGTTVHSRVSG